MALELAFQRYDLPGLFAASFAATLLMFALAILNIGATFFLWGRYRFRCFDPVLLFAVVVTVCLCGERYGTPLVLAGTPCSPDSFLVGKARSDLENAAKQALSSRRMWRGDGGQVAVLPERSVPSDVVRTMSHYRFRAVDIDDAQSLVTFSYVHMRTWYHYTYTTDHQVPLGSRPPTISDDDVDWSRLIDIVREGEHVTAEEARRDFSNLDVAYAYLRRSLGQNELNRLKETWPRQVPREHRQIVLTALNEQWSPTGRLAEGREFIYDRAANELHIGRIRMGGSFWVVRLAYKLLSEGVLTYAPDNVHLRLAESIPPSDRNRVAWLHFGLMEELYPNVLHKAEHLADKDLGNGWYFRVGE
jgi:hypothetical protein